MALFCNQQISPAHCLFLHQALQHWWLWAMCNQLREADPKAEIKMVSKLRSCQAHCVKSHLGQLVLVVFSLFVQSNEMDELTIKVKKHVFDIDD
jgi:hypothetical protein